MPKKPKLKKTNNLVQKQLKPVSFQIASLQNPKIKQALALYKKNVRDEKKLFLIEGYRELLRSCQGKVKIKQLFVCPQLFLGENENALIQKIQTQTSQIYECEEKVFRKLSYRDRPDGLIAVASYELMTLKDLEKCLNAENKNNFKNPFIVVAESIEKPGNLGTILRSVDGAGADCLILCDERTDLFNPNVIRASIGTLFTVFVIKASSSETIKFLKTNKIKIVATSPDSKTVYTKADLTQPLAVIVGSEQLGLSDNWLQKADLKVKIPMKGISDSLNVASATTLMLYEVLRQKEKNS